MTHPAKLAQLKLEVRAGTYKVNPAAVAEAIFNRTRTQNGKSGTGNLDENTRSMILALDFQGERTKDISRRVGVCPATVTKVVHDHQRPPCYHRSRRR